MDLDIADQEVLRSFLIKLYGSQVNKWPMNEKMFDTTYQLLDESSKCSDMYLLKIRGDTTGFDPFNWSGPKRHQKK